MDDPVPELGGWEQFAEFVGSDDSDPHLPRYWEDAGVYDPEWSGFRFFISILLLKYRATGNPVILRSIFDCCHKYRIYPPIEVMDWLANGVLQSDPSQIPRKLGLKAGKGKEDPLLTARRLQATSFMMREIFHLCRYTKVSISAAAEGVYLRYLPLSRSLFKYDVPAPEWLDDQYRRVWKKRFTDTNGFMDGNPERQKEFINLFPVEWRERYGLK